MHFGIGLSLHQDLFVPVGDLFNFPMCMVRIMDSRETIRQLRLAGWVYRNARGLQHIYVHPPKPGHISVPHPKKDLGIGLVAKLLTQAGLK